MKRLTPTIGAEVDGVDLGREIPEEQLAEIRRAISENLVLVFRDQDISSDDHKRFARYFGTLHSHLLGGTKALSSEKHDPEAFAWRTLIAAELVFGVASGTGGLGWFIFENKNRQETPNVFAGLGTVILIGLAVEGLLFRTLERHTVRKWGMQK